METRKMETADLVAAVLDNGTDCEEYQGLVSRVMCLDEYELLSVVLVCPIDEVRRLAAGLINGSEHRSIPVSETKQGWEGTEVSVF